MHLPYLCKSLRTISAYHPPMQERVTMAVLAKSLGLSESTISRALRGDRRIGEETRSRVARAAKELGYRPNPWVSALMSARKNRSGNGEVGTVAVVTDYHGKDGWKTKDVCRWEYEGICRRADEMGYRVEEFAMSDFNYDGHRISKTLIARGIRGVLLGFTRERKFLSGFPLEAFSVAGLSTYFREVAVNRANFHGFHNVQLALHEIRKLGFRRTGLVVPELNNRVSGYLWSGAALDWQRRLPENERCNPLVPTASHEDAEFTEWMKREKPDSLLVYKLPVKSWLAKAGLRIPDDIHLSYLYRTQDEMTEWPGIDGNLPMVGAAAFDLVIEGLHTNRYGLPPQAKEVLIKGEWRPSN
jgi:LacI family transcriptional regulator